MHLFGSVDREETAVRAKPPVRYGKETIVLFSRMTSDPRIKRRFPTAWHRPADTRTRETGSAKESDGMLESLNWLRFGYVRRRQRMRPNSALAVLDYERVIEMSL